MGQKLSKIIADSGRGCDVPASEPSSTAIPDTAATIKNQAIVAGCNAYTAAELDHCRLTSPISQPSTTTLPPRWHISTVEDVKALIPPAGIPSKLFMSKVGVTRDNMKSLFPIIGQAAVFKDGRLYLKENAPHKVGNAARKTTHNNAIGAETTCHLCPAHDSVIIARISHSSSNAPSNTSEAAGMGRIISSKGGESSVIQAFERMLLTHDNLQQQVIKMAESFILPRDELSQFLSSLKIDSNMPDTAASIDMIALNMLFLICYGATKYSAASAQDYGVSLSEAKSSVQDQSGHKEDSVADRRSLRMQKSICKRQSLRYLLYRLRGSLITTIVIHSKRLSCNYASVRRQNVELHIYSWPGALSLVGCGDV
jgi:hypothetical protein